MYICAMACMSRSEHSFTELVLSFALLWILRMNIGPRVYIWSSASILSADPSHWSAGIFLFVGLVFCFCFLFGWFLRQGLPISPDCQFAARPTLVSLRVQACASWSTVCRPGRPWIQRSICLCLPRVRIESAPHYKFLKAQWIQLRSVRLWSIDPIVPLQYH